MRGSHILHQDYFESIGGFDKSADIGEVFEGYQFKMGELDWYKERGCEIVKVCADAGDLIRTSRSNLLLPSDRHVLARSKESLFRTQASLTAPISLSPIPHLGGLVERTLDSPGGFRVPISSLLGVFTVLATR